MFPPLSPERKGGEMKNNYIVKDNIVEIYFRNTNKCFFIDKDDLEKVSQYTWYLNVTGYPASKTKGKHITAHKVIMNNAPIGMVVDHINRNKLDNRKSNLRYCTQKENNLNKERVKRPNGSIRYREGIRKNTYKVEIHDNKNKTIYIGSYRTIEEAISVRDKAFLLCENGELTPFQINKLRKSRA